MLIFMTLQYWRDKEKEVTGCSNHFLANEQIQVVKTVFQAATIQFDQHLKADFLLHVVHVCNMRRYNVPNISFSTLPAS